MKPTMQTKDKRTLLKEQIIIEIYYNIALHLPYPPSILQVCEDCHDTFQDELIYHIAEQHLYNEYNVSDFNELIFAMNTGKIQDHILEDIEIYKILQNLNMNLLENADRGVW